MWAALGAAALNSNNNSGGGQGDSAGGGGGGGGGGSWLSSLPNPGKQFTTGLMGYLGGRNANSGAPYDAAGKAYGEAYDKYFPQSQSYLDPYNQGGQQAFSNYGEALNGMSDPRAYMDDIMSSYQESPWAAFEREQGNKGMAYANSASGMGASGASMKAAADYNQGLTSRDQQLYFNNAMGVNNTYLGGLERMSGIGFNAASGQSQNAYNMARDRADMAAQTAYGKGQGEAADRSQRAGGIAGMIGSFF